MDALDALINRVSVPRLVEPAPTAAQREQLFRAALRAPDHGQLRPWRFLTIEGEARHALGKLYAEALAAKSAEVSEEALAKARNMPLRAPLLVVVIARVQEHPKVPAQEQVLAAGCAAHGILLAAHAQGIGAVWRTGELSHDRHVDAGLGLAANERIVGYLYLGTPERELRTPPQLAVEDYVSAWPGNA
ncbi:NAD(P)H nitroreductase [Pseudomonas daroniae]|uniref:Putative NAD(P)H nitroreductase n=1 Tax=Phytopseudomonas daroniae TaxID=2487519 RepID=A0A4Q9QI87_9GAMM|nr:MULTISPECIES: NAD(P)H nitroreductase [Pseudomonas]TBU73438.1 NAD(P)H nitroreductase [Pseudomonas daroniae]TBU74488.1 NAD(P)H nitroreductase [Pseudomonas daroniae]TBU79190.1 NAD(P)H nitroreductase [Pseudomonas sp. FRB 228]TBU88088.1 NAD(P)H nitroreductase [Pseudomonas daroniae]